jgi:hypothetical protein
VQVGRDVDVDDGAIVPEDVGELVAVAGVDELLVRDLVKLIKKNLTHRSSSFVGPFTGL